MTKQNDKGYSINTAIFTANAQNGERLQAYATLLTDAIDFVEVDQSKRSVYILGNLLRSLAFDIIPNERIFKRAEEVLKDENASENNLNWWTDKVTEVAPFYHGCQELFEKFGKEYDKAIVDYTSDNLDNYDLQIKTSEEILESVRAGKVKGKEPVKAQARAGLEFALKNK